MSTWNLDPTLSVPKALSVFTANLPSGAHSGSGTSSTLEDFLASSGLKKAVDDNWRVDYIIIGGGTAGLTVAARLADRYPNITVCVIEAGVYRNDPLVNVPGLYGLAAADRHYDWGYKTAPQTELNGREITSSAGKILGGSSGINYLVRMRASKPEYDAWSEFGAGWNWEGLLPHFKAAENYVAPKWDKGQIFPGITLEQDQEARRAEHKFHGRSGPVHSNCNEMYTDLEGPTIKTLNSLGIPTNRSPGHGNATGMFNIGTSVDRDTGRRSYAANTYIDPSKRRNNLFILQSCYATRILFNAEAPPVTAYGVEITWIPSPATTVVPTPRGTLYLNKEVILSAGTYNTPRLLELSGIGKGDFLKSLGINVVIDLPGVGENLQEHPFVTSDFTVKGGVFTFDRLRTDPRYQKEQQEEYEKRGTGAYATTVSAYGFIKLKTIMSDSEIDELKTLLREEISGTKDEFHKMQLKIQQGYLDQESVGDVELIMVPKVFASEPKDNKSYVSLLASLPHTVSRGTVHITSTDPLAPPKIDPKYLTSKFDTKILTKATKFIRKIANTGPLRDLVDKPSSPSESVTTEPQYERYVRNNLISMQHPVGTASMAPKELGGVVDADLRVHGSTNLRVADMSIVPLHIAAHTQDTAYAIGEKAFTLISERIQAPE